MAFTQQSQQSRFAAMALQMRILVEILLLSIWFQLTRLHGFVNGLFSSNSTTTSNSSRRKQRPHSLDLSTCQIRNPLKNLVLIDRNSPFKTPFTSGTRNEDPFLHVSQTNSTAKVPSTPQFNQLVKSLETQLGPLPYPWAIRLSSNKRIYFVNWKNGETTWVDPRLATGGVSKDTPPCQDAFRDGDPEDITPISVRPTIVRKRISKWVEDERSKVRAMNAKMLTLKSRARMARMQRHTQPLSF